MSYLDHINQPQQLQATATPSKRGPPMNAIQKTMLIEYMEKNPQLRSGTFGPDFTFKKAQTLWEIITIKLNAVPGGAKKDDWRMWRKTWADMKKNTTTKAIRYKKETVKTGGGTPPKMDLNTDDLMILDLIDKKKKIEGIPEVSESKINFEFENEIEYILDEPSESLLVGKANLQNNLIDANDEVVPKMADDHKLYTISGPGSKTKKQRLHTSLEVSKQMVNQVEYQNNIKNEYYQKKMAYLQHKITYDEKMLAIAIENLEIAKENLEVMRENLRTNSSILRILANKN